MLLKSNFFMGNFSKYHGLKITWVLIDNLKTAISCSPVTPCICSLIVSLSAI